MVCCGLQLAAPNGRSPLTAPPLDPLPPSAVVPIGLSPPSCPPSPSLAYRSLSTSLSFPSGGCASGAPRLSLFHCSVSGPHGGGQLPLPLARCLQVGTPLPWDMVVLEPASRTGAPEGAVVCRPRGPAYAPLHVGRAPVEGPPSGHPIPAVGNPSLTAAFGPHNVHLPGQCPDGGT